MTLSQSNGLLAAIALGLPTCARLQGSGRVQTLQQCKSLTIDISAIETNCGFQPFFKYKDQKKTIGLDGFSNHPFSNCFWKTHLVNLNGQTYSWHHNETFNDWLSQNPNLHIYHLDLIEEFKEIPLKDSDFQIKAHPVYSTSELEQFNVLNELMGRIEESNGPSLDNVFTTTTHHSKLTDMFQWTSILRTSFFSISGLLALVVLIKITCCMIPNCKRSSSLSNLRSKYALRKKVKTDNNQSYELTQLNPNPPITTPPAVHSVSPHMATSVYPNLRSPAGHSHLQPTYRYGQGLVWEDSCPCE